MAITKERLQELIDKGATIWYVGKDYSVNANRMVDIRLGKFNKIKNDYLLVKSGDGFHTPRYNFVAYLDELFETRKQAEWALKYHATRTEELNLPMWEEIITDDKYKYHYGLSFFDFDNYRLIVCVPNEDDNTEFIGIDVDGNTELYHWDEATEENYIKACDLCLKLFKGEQE